MTFQKNAQVSSVVAIQDLSFLVLEATLHVPPENAVDLLKGDVKNDIRARFKSR